MSGLKAIRRRIQSVKNTKQITRAMKLVSAAKLRRAQEAAENGRAYSRRLQKLLHDIMADLPDGFSHPLLERREEVRKRRVVIVGGERGLCGAFNTNTIKAAQAMVRTSAEELDFVMVGRRAKAAAQRFGWPAVAAYEGLPEDAGLWPTAEIAEQLMTDYVKGEIDEVVFVYTTFKSAMSQEVTTEVLLPFTPPPKVEGELVVQGKILYDPEPKVLLETLIPLLVKTRLMQAGLESKASEHAARMTAMDSATRNADDLIERLRLFYNRARQSAITRELIDIVGGAEAQK